RGLSNPCGRCHLIRCIARDHNDGRYLLAADQRSEKVAIILRDTSMAAIRIGHQAHHCKFGLHRASTAFDELEAQKTTRDESREMSPFGRCPLPAAGERAALDIHAPVGTANPVFARATTASGSGRDGACASAALPVPGVNEPKKGATDLRSGTSTSGTR